MNKPDLEDLERIARAASTPDEWRWRDADVLEGKRDGQIVLHCGQTDEFEDAGIVASIGDREHIAAASPPVVLWLLARIRRLEIELARAAGTTRAGGRHAEADDYMRVAQDREDFDAEVTGARP